VKYVEFLACGKVGGWIVGKCRCWGWMEVAFEFVEQQTRGAENATPGKCQESRILFACTLHLVFLVQTLVYMSRVL